MGAMPERSDPPARDDLTECVLDCVAEIPPGRVSTYGRVASEARLRCGRGGARNVGWILSREGATVPWWRVVTADGSPAAHKFDLQLAILTAEEVVLRSAGRVDLRVALHDFARPGA